MLYVLQKKKKEKIFFDNTTKGFRQTGVSMEMLLHIKTVSA